MLSNIIGLELQNVYILIERIKSDVNLKKIHLNVSVLFTEKPFKCLSTNKNTRVF